MYRDSKFMHSDKSRVKISQNHVSNLDKVFLKVPPSSDFGLEARILQIGWFYRPKWKKVEKSASKNKHPIKLRFLIWRLQSANSEKKVIPENQVWIMSFFVSKSLIMILQHTIIIDYYKKIHRKWRFVEYTSFVTISSLIWGHFYLQKRSKSYSRHPKRLPLEFQTSLWPSSLTPQTYLLKDRTFFLSLR